MATLNLYPFLLRQPLLRSSWNELHSTPNPKLHRSAQVRKCALDASSGSGNFQRPDEKPSVPFWRSLQVNAEDLRAKIGKLGLAAVLAYGLFDGITYTAFFVLAFLGYEKSTGKNPAANLQALLGIVILMWTGNNVTRPFRVAGAAATAPLVDKFLRKIQETFNLPNQFIAFLLFVISFAGVCLSIVGLLILSRWGK